MSAPAARKMHQQRRQAASSSGLRGSKQRLGCGVCASCSINRSRDARSADGMGASLLTSDTRDGRILRYGSDVPEWRCAQPLDRRIRHGA
jgi:hypothetical protein